MTGSVAVASAVLVQSLASELPMQVFSGDFLELAVLFFVLAIVAAVFGARGVAGLSMEIAKWLVVIFIVLAVVSVIL
ncbi:DUF1328 domain-containing protein [Salinirussus salinus]|uniref:DUF1328 domain-containing protein n=1 Tax=Salinirussus salinus TaxID=1198300 RepID=UPI0013588800|nr:DUF1328 domain-containing protein [Salinirussus salinus]